MIQSSFITMLLICMVCSFCGKDFISLGRHSWRCKQRMYLQENYTESNERRMPTINTPNIPITQRTLIKCCCGKACKGNRGLKMHQRSCQILHGLTNELLDDLAEEFQDAPTDITHDQHHDPLSNLDVIPEIKKHKSTKKRFRMGKS